MTTPARSFIGAPIFRATGAPGERAGRSTLNAAPDGPPISPETDGTTILSHPRPRRYTPIGIAAVVAAVVALTAAADVAAHSNPCHMRHACPSDHHTYRWGPKKLLCTSYAAERRKKDSIVVTVGGRRYWCGK